MGTLVMIGQFLLGITILVGVHEAGHMLFAKLFGMRVEKFSIGFPPVAFSFKKGETIYQIGMIPLGGFVKIAGMVDESMDAEQMAEPSKPWEFRSKPAWQRLLVMLGGVIFNIILGCIIFASLFYKYGENYYSASELKYGVISLEIGDKLGFKDGDEIIAINDKSVTKSTDISDPTIYFNDRRDFLVQREGKEVLISIPEEFSLMNEIVSKKGFLTYDHEFTIQGLDSLSKAGKEGLKNDDRFLMIDSIETPTFGVFKRVLTKHTGEMVSLQILRGLDTVFVSSLVDSSGRLGIPIGPINMPKVINQQYSLIQSLVKGPSEAFLQFYMNAKGIQAIILGRVEARKAAGGIIPMVKAYGSEISGVRFWTISGMLSMALALFNLLPIPGLDGGHVMFLSYELLTGRKASQKVQEIALKIGFALLIFLMLFVNINDIIVNFF